MKIKGSIEFSNIEIIKKNLHRIIKQDGDCENIKCESCIFTRLHAEDENTCTMNSIFKVKNEEAPEIVERAKEILKEIENNEN
jgi:hypothetical protein